MKTIVKICSNLAIKTPQSGVVIVDFEQIPHIIQVFPLLSQWRDFWGQVPKKEDLRNKN